jgi:signal transduction histidine kinase
VKLIVADHRGSLQIDTTPGGGTTLVIRLPKDPYADTGEPGYAGD